MVVAVEVVLSDMSSDVELYKAVGRPSCYSGMGPNGRDHGWICVNEFETEKVKSVLRKFGLTPIVVELESDE